MNISETISQALREKEAAERASHESSGKLSAGILYKPAMEQVLKVLGVPEKPLDDYVLRLFERGNQCEDWVVSMLPEGDTQLEAEYKDTVGYIDYVGDELVEVKSIKRSQVRWLKKEGAKWAHKLQATLYALSEGRDEYTIIYVVADDFETFEFKHKTSEHAEEVDSIIDEVYSAIQFGKLPEFKAREPWQAKPEYASKYSSFPDWVTLTPEQAMRKLENNYKDAFNKLKG